MMISMELPLVICLLSSLNRVRAQYDPGPRYQVGVPVKLGPPGNFVTAFNFEDFLSSAPPKQYVATVLSNNEAISISPTAHSLPDPHQPNSPALPGEHRQNYEAVLNKQPTPQDFTQAIPVYPSQVPDENSRGRSESAHIPPSAANPGQLIRTHGPVSNDGAIQLPRERVSVSSFSSMQAAKDTFGEEIKLDPRKFRKDLDNVEWREEIVFPRPGVPRIKWDPRTYTEDERIVKARNNRYVYAEFRDGSEVDDALDQTGRRIPPKVKPSLNLLTAQAAAQYDPNRTRPLRTHLSEPAERGNPHGKVVYGQQQFRVKEEEQLRSQFGYTGRAQPASRDHEVRYYPEKHTGDRVEPSSGVDYARAFGQEPQPKPHRSSQFQASSDASDEDPRTPRSAVVQYGSGGYGAPKSELFNHQKGDGTTAGIGQAAYEDGDYSHLTRPRDAQVYGPGRQHRQQNRHQEEDSEHDEHSVYKRKVPKYVTQDSVGKTTRGDLEEYSRKSGQRSSSPKRKIQQHRQGYRPDPDSEEIPVTHVQAHAARSESTGYIRAPKHTSVAPKKYVTPGNAEDAIRYKRKKKPVYYDDEDDDPGEAEREKQRSRRFSIRFENNPGEPFSFRKENRKGDSVEEVDEMEDDYHDRISLHPRSVLRSLRAESEPGEGGVNLSFRLA